MIAHTIINTIFILAQVYVVFFSSYNMILWVISLFFKEKEYPETLTSLKHKFSFLICCHNEENVIADIIHSIRKIDYPSHLYEIFVVCDNCSPEDKSIQICKSLNVNVIERYNKNEKGKGYAIEYALEKMFDMGDLYIGEGIIVLDADNLLSSNVLIEANKRLNAGENIIQFMVDTKNVKDSIVTKADAMAFWNSSIFYQQVRSRLGLNVQLMGTNMLFRTSTLKQIGWNAKSLAEDMELSAIYPIQKNDKVYFCKDAYCLDEKPLTIKASWNQRLRWISSHWSLAISLSPKLFRYAVKHRSLIAFDNLMYLIQPLRIALSTALITLGFISANTELTSIIPYPIWFILFSFYIFQMSYAIKVYDNLRHIYWIIGVYFVNLMWIPLTVYSFFTRNNRVWSHTVHTQSVNVLKEQQVNETKQKQTLASGNMTVVE